MAVNRSCSETTPFPLRYVYNIFNHSYFPYFMLLHISSSSSFNKTADLIEKCEDFTNCIVPCLAGLS
jgi:hypothetical protein